MEINTKYHLAPVEGLPVEQDDITVLDDLVYVPRQMHSAKLE